MSSIPENQETLGKLLGITEQPSNGVHGKQGRVQWCREVLKQAMDLPPGMSLLYEMESTRDVNSTKVVMYRLAAFVGVTLGWRQTDTLVYIWVKPDESAPEETEPETEAEHG